jgi:hypothetical protein
VDTCQQLVVLFAEQPQRRSIFLAEDGMAALMELLQERSHKARHSQCACRTPWNAVSGRLYHC